MSLLTPLVKLNPSPALLLPVIGLNSWTFIMEGWMYYHRINWMTNRTDGKEYSNTHTKSQFESSQPAEVRWKADNYNHLFEQPTQFYAVSLTLALLGAERNVDLGLAWGYVGIRVAHSLVQSTTNHIMTRFSLYIINSMVLFAMTARAGLMLLGHLSI